MTGNILVFKIDSRRARSLKFEPWYFWLNTIEYTSNAPKSSGTRVSSVHGTANNVLTLDHKANKSAVSKILRFYVNIILYRMRLPERMKRVLICDIIGKYGSTCPATVEGAESRELLLSGCVLNTKQFKSLQILVSMDRPRNSFFGGSKLLQPVARPGSKSNFVVAKLYVHFLWNENILIL